MTYNDLIERLAEAFNIEPNEEGEYDLSDYDWQSGCYSNGAWLSLANVVEALEDLCEEEDSYEED